MKKNKKGGFTLIEILVVIGIIAILATIVIIAINPARQFAQARDTQRISNLDTILNAIGQNIADNKGSILSATTCTGIANVPDATVRNISTNGTGTTVNLSCLIPTYISSAVPMDPSTATGATDSLYTITYDGVRYHICTSVLEPSIPRATQLCSVR